MEVNLDNTYIMMMMITIMIMMIIAVTGIAVVMIIVVDWYNKNKVLHGTQQNKERMPRNI